MKPVAIVDIRVMRNTMKGDPWSIEIHCSTDAAAKWVYDNVKEFTQESEMEWKELQYDLHKSIRLNPCYDPNEVIQFIENYYERRVSE